MAEVTVQMNNGESLKVTAISGGFKFETVGGQPSEVGVVILANARPLRDFFTANVPTGGKGGVTPAAP